MEKLTKNGFLISLVGCIILLGVSAMYNVLAFILVFVGGAGIVGIIVGYYGGKVGAYIYVSLGILYGILPIAIIIRLGLVIWFDLFVGVILFFIGSMVAYFGWHREGYLKGYIPLLGKKRDPSYDSAVKHFQPTFKEFRRAQPYVCGACGEFTFALRDICENCGAEQSLRQTTKRDYKDRSS